MIAQEALLGRPRSVSAVSGARAVAQGGGFERGVLATVLAGGILFEAGTPDKLLELGTYLHRGIESWSGLPFPMSPLEVLLMLGLFGAANSAMSESGIDRRRALLGRPMLFFAIALLAGLLRGAVGDGDMYIGLWELRYLLYVPACYVIARSALRSTAHVAHLLRVGLAAAMLLALEGAYRRMALIDSGSLGVIPEFAYEHETALFLALFVLFTFGVYVFRAFGRVRWLAVVFTPLLLYTLFATERRAGVVVLLIGMVVVAVTVFWVNRPAFFVTALPVLAITALYVALFWNTTGLLGQPARAIRSLYEPDARDAASNFYRMLETHNISVTIHSDPVLGVGFGRPFIMAAPLPDLSWWPFWRYETHNNVLWVWMKTGIAGYLLFWFLVGSAVTCAANAAKRLSDAHVQSAALFGLVAVIGTVVYAYVDLGFVSGRVTVFLGTMLGVLAVLERLDRPARSTQAAT